MSDDNDLQLFPAWRQAVKVLIDRGLTFGDVVTREEIVELCRVKPAQSIADVARFNMEIMGCVDKIRNDLVEQHSMWLHTTRSGGWMVVHPKDQTRIAVNEGMKAISREMRRMARATTFIRTDLLTDEGRARNADAQAKISRLADLMSPVKRDLKAIANGKKD